MKQLAFGFLVLALTACTGSLLDSKLPVPIVYVLAPAPVNASSAPISSALAVSYPTAAPGLDTDRIAVLHEARRLDYYREAQWSAALPQVVQTLVVGSLQNQNRFASVTTEQARVNANYLLDLEVRDFQAEYVDAASPPTVKVTMVGSLIRIKDRMLLGVLPTSIRVDAKANRMSAVVEAFESAAQQAALALGEQAAATVSANSAN